MMVSIPDFVIPETEVTPPDRICVQFTIPNNETYKQVMIGWIDQLTYWFNWQRDAGKNGRICSNLFKQSRDELLASFTDGCTGEETMWLRFRYKPEDSRVTQVQYADGGEWTDAFNLTCCEPLQATNHQFTADGGMEVSYDNGVTWEPDPDDPRNDVVILPPPDGTSANDIRCKVASSVTQAIRQQADKLIADASIGAGINGLVAALIGLLIYIGIIGSGGLLTPLLLGLAAALIEAGSAAFEAAMTATVYQALQCIVYCSVKPDGSIDQSGLDTIRTKVRAQLTGVAMKFIDDTLGIWQLAGVNNAGHSGFTTEFDCAVCDCQSCDLSGWSQWVNGTILEQDATHIVIQSVKIGTTWHAGIRNVDINACCCDVQFAVGEGQLITALGYVPCGSANDDQTFMSFTYVGQLANGFAMAGTEAANPPTGFVVTITGNSEGDCE